MKRTRHIDLHWMRKPGLLAVGAATLSGCDSSQLAKVYQTPLECELDNPAQSQQCELAYRNAQADWQRSAPQYRSERDCEYDFGNDNCEAHPGLGAMFIPLMAGFMLGENFATDDDFDLDFRRSKPLGRSKSRYSQAYNKWVGADGTLFGSYGKQQLKVGRDALRPLKGGAKVLGRGGFGQTVSSRARSSGSWGS
ncbi:DUF1190 domain-containing protein [Marinobacterium arenosum]|uniref:DUF1190 domain-containing protein n=1 Tax=Marinobacterium arenosum TaxID=2862496 RepID=UPI001C93F1BA|nr:DUF1190 domain-containing protein [Marinobacterium arenosum]MBY4676349.1 DUF1190 domain-containing protein [Marinobacterium arenosum]